MEGAPRGRQVQAGCSVVLTPPDHPRWPGLPVVVFPGNVGGPEGLVTAYRRMGRLDSDPGGDP